MKEKDAAPGADCRHVAHASTGRRCARCLGPLWHSTQTQLQEAWGWDALFCAACDEWAEEACEEPGCRFCADRPARPSEAPYPLEVKHDRLDA